MHPIATYSIVAYDPVRKEWGIGVQSKFLAVGAVVPWAKANVGAVATQSFADLTFGPRGLALLAQRTPADETIQLLLADDEDRELRQIGVVDRQGQAAAFTGSGCLDWAGHVLGDGFACQGNILVPGTVEAMAARFQAARQGEGELADWLVQALDAGEEAGGDRRGRQAAALLVVREGGGYGGNNDRYLDLRVDDYPYPLEKLKRLVELHHLYFGEVNPDDLISLAEIAADLQLMLRQNKRYVGPISGIFDDDTRAALFALVGIENLEERWDGEGDMIDRQVVDYLMEVYG
ncbi:MAG: DUF1028 domain-containing protein [Caldilineales bacterium]|nr:DUF1028 domain-containing protein [Caldilineales bacterium]